MGGGFTAFLSFTAERVSEKNAGIIISLPSTVAISFFFIGWSTSPEKVADFAPILPLTIGSIMIFTITYLYLSKINLPKITSIIICALTSVIVWLAMNVPFAIFQFKNLSINLTIYLFLMLIGYYFITIRPKTEPYTKLIKYTLPQKIWRASFSGSIICLAVLFAKILGPFWGGIFSGFPAVYLSSLTILHWYYDSNFLFRVWRNSPIGSVVFIVFPLSAIYTFPNFGILIGTVLSYVASLLMFFIVTKLKKFPV